LERPKRDEKQKKKRGREEKKKPVSWGCRSVFLNRKKNGGTERVPNSSKVEGRRGRKEKHLFLSSHKALQEVGGPGKGGKVKGVSKRKKS